MTIWVNDNFLSNSSHWFSSTSYFVPTESAARNVKQRKPMNKCYVGFHEVKTEITVADITDVIHFDVVSYW